MTPKRRTEEAQPRGTPNPMHSPQDQRAVGSLRALTPLAGFDVELPQSSVRGATPRHSQEATQPAPARTKHETPSRSRKKTAQPTEWTPTQTKDDGATGKTPPRHSQESAQPPHFLLTERTSQCRERQSQEATQPTDNPLLSR